MVTFEELGVDRLFVDESHYYKNLYLYTKMRNVGGIAQTEAQKSSDLFMKCRYLDEITGGRGTVFATGTPISNSMVELYTMPIGMLVVLDSILNRITQNRAKGKNTFIFIDEIYLLFQHEYSANFLFTLWKRVRKYGAYASGITQNVDDLLQSHTARTMLANSEFIIMLNQASTDRLELAKLLNISDLQMSYITNVEAGHGLIKVGSSLVPFANKFPKNTKLYKLMTTKPGEA